MLVVLVRDSCRSSLIINGKLSQENNARYVQAISICLTPDKKLSRAYK